MYYFKKQRILLYMVDVFDKPFCRTGEALFWECWLMPPVSSGRSLFRQHGRCIFLIYSRFILGPAFSFPQMQLLRTLQSRKHGNQISMIFLITINIHILFSLISELLCFNKTRTLISYFCNLCRLLKFNYGIRAKFKLCSLHKKPTDIDYRKCD